MANEQPENAAANKVSVARLTEALSRGDVGAFDAIMAPGYIAHHGANTLTLDDVKREYATLLHAFPDGSWTLDLQLAAEDGAIVSIGAFRGSQGAEFAGIGAAGQHVAIPFFWVFRFSGGEGWVQRDLLALQQQIGGQIVPA